MGSAAPGVPKVIFNQRAYQTFQGMDEKFSASPYLVDEFLGTIVVSEDSRKYLNYVFPKHRVVRIHSAVDPSLFYRPLKKGRRIAYMPRKLPADLRQVIAVLNQRGRLDGFDFIAIDNISETQVAAVMRDAMIFLNFSSQEGSPTSPLEAMACVCLTIGYDGQGGREYLNDEFAVRVAEEDVLGFVTAIETAIAEFRDAPELIERKLKRAVAYVAVNHSPLREQEDIAAAWQQLLAPVP